MATVYSFPIKNIQDEEITLEQYQGKVILLVNVASECGLTPQYSELQELYEKYNDQLVVIGFPCNQFGAQEPGTEAEILAFCSTKYAVTFPMMAKVEVNGEGKHALYNFLSGSDAKHPGDITWNFEKFLVGKNGEVLERFSPKTSPLDAEVISAIDAAL